MRRTLPATFDLGRVARCYASQSRRAEDAEHWLEGFRKAGLID
jgi:hypothetical protein